MNVVAIQTARKGSKSVINKNKIFINDVPLFLINLLYAKKSQHINSVYVSTDDLDIKTLALRKNIKVIDRPDHLCQDNSSHYDAIHHAIQNIEQQQQIDLIVVLLGNNKGAYTSDLNKAITILQNNNSADSIISVSSYNMFHPCRAYKQNNEYITSYMHQNDIGNSLNGKHLPNDKNAFEPAYFFNGSFWIIRKNIFLKNNGLQPFSWLGNNILPYYQREGIMELDAMWQLPLFNS